MFKEDHSIYLLGTVRANACLNKIYLKHEMQETLMVILFCWLFLSSYNYLLKILWTARVYVGQKH